MTSDKIKENLHIQEGVVLLSHFPFTAVVFTHHKIAHYFPSLLCYMKRFCSVLETPAYSYTKPEKKIDGKFSLYENKANIIKETLFIDSF